MTTEMVRIQSFDRVEYASATAEVRLTAFSTVQRHFQALLLFACDLMRGRNILLNTHLINFIIYYYVPI